MTGPFITSQCVGRERVSSMSLVLHVCTGMTQNKARIKKQTNNEKARIVLTEEKTGKTAWERLLDKISLTLRLHNFIM